MNITSGLVLWSGLTLILAVQHWVPEAALIGAVVMIIGCVMMAMGK